MLARRLARFNPGGPPPPRHSPDADVEHLHDRLSLQPAEQHDHADDAEAVGRQLLAEVVHALLQWGLRGLLRLHHLEDLAELGPDPGGDHDALEDGRGRRRVRVLQIVSGSQVITAGAHYLDMPGRISEGGQHNTDSLSARHQEGATQGVENPKAFRETTTGRQLRLQNCVDTAVFFYIKPHQTINSCKDRLSESNTDPCAQPFSV